MCVMVVCAFTVLKTASIAKEEAHRRRRTSPLWSDGPSTVCADTRFTFA